MVLVLHSIAVVATVLGSWMSFPQARRLLRTRQVEGLSPMWIGVSVSINGWWLAYGLFAGVWALVPVSSISLVLYSTMAFVYLRETGRRGLAGLVAGAAGLGMTPLPFLLVGGWSLAGVAVGLAYGVQLLPAVVTACRTSELAGIAAGTWWLAVAEAALWLVYGAVVRDLALLLAGAAGTVMGTIILVRLAVTGHRPLTALVPARSTAVATAG